MYSPILSLQHLLPTLLISWLFLLANVAADSINGWTAYAVGDYETAFREWKASAEQGDPYSQF